MCFSSALRFSTTDDSPSTAFSHIRLQLHQTASLPRYPSPRTTTRKGDLIHSLGMHHPHDDRMPMLFHVLINAECSLAITSSCHAQTTSDDGRRSSSFDIRTCQLRPRTTISNTVDLVINDGHFLTAAFWICGLRWFLEHLHTPLALLI